MTVLRNAQGKSQEFGTKIKTLTLKFKQRQLFLNEGGKECYFFLFVNTAWN